MPSRTDAPVATQQREVHSAGCLRCCAYRRAGRGPMRRDHAVSTMVVRDPLAISDVAPPARRRLHLEGRGHYAGDAVRAHTRSRRNRRGAGVAALAPSAPSEPSSTASARRRRSPGRSAPDGSRRSAHDPSAARSCSANSMRPSARRCAATRTSTPASGVAVNMLSDCASTVSGELDSQRPTSAFAGKNRDRGSTRSPHAPSASRCWRANSVRPSARRCAATRTSTSPPAPWAAATGTPRSASRSSATRRSTAGAAAARPQRSLIGRMLFVMRSPASPREPTTSVTPARPLARVDARGRGRGYCSP